MTRQTPHSFLAEFIERHNATAVAAFIQANALFEEHENRPLAQQWAGTLIGMFRRGAAPFGETMALYATLLYKKGATLKQAVEAMTIFRDGPYSISLKDKRTGKDLP